MTWTLKKDLQGIDWTFATCNNDANLGFEAFDKHAPIKKLIAKKKKEKDILKI